MWAEMTRGEVMIPSQVSLNFIAQSTVEAELTKRLPDWIEECQADGDLLFRQLAWVGSLAHGGFSGLFSDFDLAIFIETQRPLAADRFNVQLDRLRYRLPQPNRWSFFWCWAPREDARAPGAVPPQLPSWRIGRFPSLDVWDYLEHGRAIVGSPDLVAGLSRPKIEQIRDHLKNHSVQYWREQLSTLSRRRITFSQRFDPLAKDYLRLCLYPARFYHSWQSGRVDSVEVAVQSQRHLPWFDAQLVDASINLRHQLGDPASRRDQNLFDDWYDKAASFERVRAQMEGAFAIVSEADQL